MCVCVCVCMHACVCVYACMCVCSQASRSLATLSCDSSFFFLLWIHLYLNNRFFLGLTLSETLDHRVQGQNLGHLKKSFFFFFAFIFLICNQSYFI